MEHINYEERYPTVVDTTNTPQLFPQALAEDSPRYSTIVDQKKPSIAVASGYPEAVTPIDPYSKSAAVYQNAVVRNEDVQVESMGDDRSGGGKRYCGMSKPAFLLVLVLVIVLIVGAVGGAVGGVLAGKSKKATSSVSGSGSGTSQSNITSTQTSSVATRSTTSTSTTSSTTPTSLATTLDTSKSIGSISTSTFADGKVYIHLYYQQDTNIGYHVYDGSSFTAAQSLDFTIAPKAGSPLAAVETSSSGNSYMSLFYLDSSNNIILANYTSALGGRSLTLKATVQIVAGTSVYTSSQLAAVYVDSSNGFRMYYQTPNRALQEMVGVRSKWTSGATISSATANGGSPLTVTSISAPGILQINLLYNDATSNSLSNVVYSGGWSTGSALYTSDIDHWDGANRAIAGIAQATTSPMNLRTYYVGSNNKLYEIQDPDLAADWNNSDYSDVWPTADSTAAGGLAGIAWGDQVMVYYVSDSKLVELTLDGGWTVSKTFE